MSVGWMEAVRSDSTPLARHFQVELLRRLFSGDGEAELRALGRETAARLLRGELDGELVCRKKLRRPAEAYETQTPQVRAARLLGWTDRRGRVDYVITRSGPEPVEARSGAPLDYEHYLERQLHPIAESIAQALGAISDDWLGDAGQLGLFTSPGAAVAHPVD